MNELLTEKEVAAFLNAPLSTVRHWRYTRQLLFVKLGRHVRIRWDDLEDFIRRHGGVIVPARPEGGR